jgi:hypothetical protein
MSSQPLECCLEDFQVQTVLSFEMVVNGGLIDASIAPMRLPQGALIDGKISARKRCCARRLSELFRVFCEKFVGSCAPSAPMSA